MLETNMMLRPTRAYLSHLFVIRQFLVYFPRGKESNKLILGIFMRVYVRVYIYILYKMLISKGCKCTVFLWGKGGG